MTANLALEYQGFLKFLTRANQELHKWFGPHCNHDASRIAFLASREWDGMADLERKPFIRSHNAADTSSNPYIRYLLHNRYNEAPDSPAQDSIKTFDRKSAKSNAQKWRSLTQEERAKFSEMKTHEHGIEHVIEKRNRLHEIYDPKQLCILEFILKTKPRWPSNSRMWFYRHECHSLASKLALDRWENLKAEERDVFERCALIDRKRYEFEKNAWVTRILATDFEENNFTLSNFDISDIKSRFDSIGSFVEISKELPSFVGLRRPRNPFSLFIEAYRYQIRDERPEFQFGKHLRECSEAWSRLSDEERNFYKRESEKLKEKRKSLLASEPRADDRLTIPVELFIPSKSIYGPCRPAHLYPKLPTAMGLWAEENQVDPRKRLSLWKELPEDIRRLYEQRRESLRPVIAKQKLDIDRKHQYIKSLLREAVKLEDLKVKLHLIGSSKKAVKNLYA